jgi:hypothetical protein
VEEYRERIVRLEEKIEEMKSMQKEHHICLFGNGKPGLKYDMLKIKNAIYFNNVVTTILTTALIGNLIKWVFA